MKTTESRFWEKVSKTESCWNWIGCVTQKGYGQFFSNGKRIYAHRYSLLLVGRLMPKDLVTDHLCRNRKCVNPSHLEMVTNAENIRRGLGMWNKDECKRGHKLDEENTRFYRNGRHCRKCNAFHNRNWRRKLKLNQILPTLHAKE